MIQGGEGSNVAVAYIASGGEAQRVVMHINELINQAHRLRATAKVWEELHTAQEHSISIVTLAALLLVCDRRETTYLKPRGYAWLMNGRSKCLLPGAGRQKSMPKCWVGHDAAPLGASRAGLRRDTNSSKLRRWPCVGDN